MTTRKATERADGAQSPQAEPQSGAPRATGSTREGGSKQATGSPHEGSARTAEAARATHAGGAAHAAGSAHDHVLPSYARSPIDFVRGEGAWMIASDGARYLDFLSGIGVNALGHAHPRLVAALSEQLGTLVHTSNLYRSRSQERVSARLFEATGLEYCFFSNSGTEANEAGLKMARRFHKEAGAPRAGVLALEDGFHGRTFGALSATWNEKYRKPFEPLVPTTTWIAPGDSDALERELTTRDYGVFLCEVIQGEAGVRPVDFGFLRRARELCDATGTLLFVDEVQSGCGRTGRFLASQIAGVQPDIVSLAKPLGAGVPIGATLCTAAIGSRMTPGTHGSTFGGNALACRAAEVFLAELFDHELLDRVTIAGERFALGLDKLAKKHDHVTCQQGHGLMRALVLDRDAGPFADAMLREHLLAIASGGNRLRFLPPFIVSDDEIDEAIARIDRALTLDA
ncbi:MAG: acetylornithine transaminase [Planctomycetes bacterium]|nr:acetylornithine transaminase [Planctomycetota bacterium]MCB9917088.1 acetylornithine transaminase [Planctomycetota bacterium]